jgi:hypothetical protein
MHVPHIVSLTSLLQGAAEFYCPGQLTREMDLKAACVGFRGDLWYHLNFLAPPWGGGVAEMRPFFAELRFEACSDRIVVETCTILGTYIALNRSSKHVLAIGFIDLS